MNLVSDEVTEEQMNCRHTHFGIIKSKSHGVEMFELHCAKCDMQLPFFFYTKREWKEYMEAVNDAKMAKV